MLKNYRLLFRIRFLKSFLVSKKVSGKGQGKLPVILYEKCGFRLHKNSRILIKQRGKMEMGKYWGREPSMRSDFSMAPNSTLELNGYSNIFQGRVRFIVVYTLNNPSSVLSH